MSEIKDAHDGADDAIHQGLRRSVEKRVRGVYLWVPGDSPSFIPRLLPIFYGDGRALFSFGTLNQRPAYWVIRACSSWGSGMDRENSKGPDIVELIDDVINDLEEAFGRGRCSYSGNSLFWPKKERMRNCKCEDCCDRYMRARFPMVDDCGGSHWGRINWPKGFETVDNPLSWRGNLLARA